MARADRCSQWAEGLFWASFDPPEGTLMAGTKSSSGPKVLIVDDDAASRGLARMHLEAEGDIIVAEADDGRQAIRCAQAFRPDIVFLDVGMPGMNGLEALPHIRRASPNSAIIMFSASDRTTYERAALALGAVAYVEKRGDGDELVKQVRDVYRQRGAGLARPPVPLNPEPVRHP